MEGGLALGYVLEGELERLRIPPPGPGGLGHELWRHTCFEAFVARDGVAGYVEVNLSPSGEWTAFAFRSYRERESRDPLRPAPRLTVRRTARCLEVEATIALADAGGPLCVALTAVVESASGALTYWSLYHPPGPPDFHHADAFALRVDAARMRR